MINIKSDSRKVKQGDIFVALKGINSNGDEYIEQAIKKGATKIIVESNNKYSVDTIKVDDTRKYLINYLNSNYNKYLESMTIIGITGTNGKTTTGYLIYQALNKLNIKCAYIGTIGFYLNDKVCNLPNTSPDICDIYDMIMMAYNNKYRIVVMETSSQGLDMGRLEGIKFDYAIFTNLTQDHLDYHKTMENYAKAKQKLFYNLKESGVSLINSDDKYKNYFNIKNVKDYGKSAKNYIIKEYKLGYKTFFKLNIDGLDYEFNTKLIGEYNVYNLVSCIALLNEMKIDIAKIKGIVNTLTTPPGRMDIVNYSNNLIIIDYAHTPDAMNNIYNTVNIIKKGDIYTVFGCTGSRDKTKRPIMMESACLNSKRVIITSDDLHDEEFDSILNDMLLNNNYLNYDVIPDRGIAIKKGISLLKENDILLILGKGHEEFIIVKDKKIPFNDKRCTLSILESQEKLIK